jgi:hypothetical protein
MVVDLVEKTSILTAQASKPIALWNGFTKQKGAQRRPRQ